MIATPVEKVLSALYRYGTLACYDLGNAKGLADRLGFVWKDTVDKPHAKGLLSTEVPRCQADVLNPGVRADDLGHSRQGAHITRHSDVNFLDTEHDVGCADAQVGTRADVQGDADRDTVQNADHR